MKLLSTLLSVLPFTASAFAAKRSSAGTDVFPTYHKQAASSGSITLTDSSYDELTALPRNHSVLVVLTALEARFGCKMCQDFKPEWDTLAKSWMRGDKKGESRLLFGELDFEQGRSTFEKLRLTTAPVMYLFPPTSGPDASPSGEPIAFEFPMGPPSAELVRDWTLRYLPSMSPVPKIYRPINYVKILTWSILVSGGATAAFVAWPYVMPVLQNRNLWAVISLLAVLVFTSGHMFNHIRQTPYVGGNGKGGISYFAGGFQNQYGLETQIVGAIYAVLAFATVALAVKTPRIQDKKLQTASVVVWGVVVYLTYSFLLSVFRMKNGGYPFWLPPF